MTMAVGPGYFMSCEGTRQGRITIGSPEGELTLTGSVLRGMVSGFDPGAFTGGVEPICPEADRAAGGETALSASVLNGGSFTWREETSP